MNRLVARTAALIASLGPIGKLPFPGTCGTLCAIPLLYKARSLIGLFPGCSEQFIILLLTVLSFWIINAALYVLPYKDPQEIVLDEVVGFAITLFGFPFNPLVLILGFVYFRFFDITKPLGISSLENMPGALGILADDIAAGALAHLATSLTLTLFSRLL